MVEHFLRFRHRCNCKHLESKSKWYCPKRKYYLCQGPENFFPACIHIETEKGGVKEVACISEQKHIFGHVCLYLRRYNNKQWPG